VPSPYPRPTGSPGFATCGDCGDRDTPAIAGLELGSPYHVTVVLPNVPGHDDYAGVGGSCCRRGRGRWPGVLQPWQGAATGGRWNLW
jgi:hypothetical protein